MDNKVKAYLQAFGVSEATQRFLSKPQRMFIGGAWLEASDGGSRVFSKRRGNGAAAVLRKGAGRSTAMPSKLLVTCSSGTPRRMPSVAV